MVIKIFKITTSIVLLGVLVILIEKRNLLPVIKTTSDKNNLYNSQDYQPILRETPTVEQSDQEVRDSSYQQTSTSSDQIPQIKTISSIKKVDEYLVLREQGSDTDETYKPIISPCVKPMSFKIGIFDAHFGISKTAFIEEIKKASTLWGDELNKELFYYDENGLLTINLIYDERQAKTVDIGYLALEIENSKQNAESLRVTYEKEKEIFLEEGNTLIKESDRFQEKRNLYMAKVTKYNAEGGAPPEEYEIMTNEFAELKKEASLLDAKRESLNNQVPSINTKVARYNELIAYTNSLIKKSNSLGAQKFTEGRFTPKNNTIDIYQYNDIIQLRRVIAHELGHVLGINHTENVHSIMYSINNGTSTTLSTQDKEALRVTCAKN